MRRLLIRADGDEKIGYGHVYRSLALAQMMSDKYEVVFVSSTSNEKLRKTISDICKEVIWLNTETFFDEFLNHIMLTDIVVLDNYFNTTDYQQKVKNRAYKLVCIDDIHQFHFVADAIINHSPSANPKDYSIESDTKLFFGVGYSLLREPFLTINTSNLKSYNNILISFGGADPNNLTVLALKATAKSKRWENIHVMVGGAYQHLNELLDIVKANTNTILHQNLSDVEVAELMSSTSVALISSSTMMIEALSAKMLIVCGYAIDNQIEIYNAALNQGMVYGIGDLNDCNWNEIPWERIINLKEKILNKNIVDSSVIVENFHNLFKSIE